eukprot:TRINITY_DN42566_c0_g1_i1.p4 TRINITY_DN42566_c0_g1~~TRINITY_DN42566_c0_g1_i1.p4  ORF type:complete len:113 (-),score=13.69 TRINITY_DN42566_c0_g1_i1:162-500(-)
MYFLDEESKRHEWKTKSYFQMIRMFYGLLSFPFLIFSIPFLNNILTKSRPTGYDKYGRCLPKIQLYIEQQQRKILKLKAEQEEQKLLINEENGFEDIIDDIASDKNLSLIHI